MPWGDCWNGGGLFLDNNRYWLNRGHRLEISKTTDDQRLIEDPDVQLGERRMSECPGIYYLRLVRDGWIEVANFEAARKSNQIEYDPDRHGTVF
jgi:hypothetical protein